MPSGSDALWGVPGEASSGVSSMLWMSLETDSITAARGRVSSWGSAQSQLPEVQLNSKLPDFADGPTLLAYNLECSLEALVGAQEAEFYSPRQLCC